ncbi:hypothetical protein N7468_006819 [Penicillium chermesinum]|uniref:Enoyl reductase (ER) domain-containing protein n=1 Tax=Penicillium chermesinum TaxID=63820 RepID=A0A9W9NVR4_9EURO|nr:uncharacterized protein N7468_006819 [Penicillium chermesinum]KAJ5225594.1 hypothetical protein N7468_006819 [Penicillium chermesinum]KAJ6161187.1 hypothetical protein N7470_004583 [Penicillium chermesinum]
MPSAVRFHGRGDIRVDHLEEPKCGRGEIKLKPAFAGICGSDLHEYTGGPVLVPEEEHPLTHQTYPVTLGHEFSGTIVAVGEGVEGFSPGQRAVVRPTIYDTECSACRDGCEQCCTNIGFIGLSGYGGGMSRYIVAPAGHFYALPDSISFETAALIEPLAVAWHAVNISPMKPDNNVLVLGGGPIGIAIIQILKLKGAKNIILVELMEKRKKLAETFGATHTLDPREVDIPKEAHVITEDKGVDLVFDTAGIQGALNGVIPACKAHGTIVNIAVWEKSPNVQVNDLMYHEINYMGAALYDENAFTEVIEALAEGKLQPQKMISSIIHLSDAVEKGFQELIDHRDQHCKILINSQA